MKYVKTLDEGQRNALCIWPVRTPLLSPVPMSPVCFGMCMKKLPTHTNTHECTHTRMHAQKNIHPGSPILRNTASLAPSDMQWWTTSTARSKVSLVSLHQCGRMIDQARDVLVPRSLFRRFFCAHICVSVGVLGTMSLCFLQYTQNCFENEQRHHSH